MEFRGYAADGHGCGGGGCCVRIGAGRWFAGRGEGYSARRAGAWRERDGGRGSRGSVAVPSDAVPGSGGNDESPKCKGIMVSAQGGGEGAGTAGGSDDAVARRILSSGRRCAAILQRERASGLQDCVRGR